MKVALFTLAAILVTVVSPAAAQSNRPRPERPSRALFGGGHGDWDQQLTLSGQIGGGYDDNTMGGGNVPNAPDTPVGGVAAPYTQGAMSAMYSLRRGRAKFDLSGSASVAHYRSIGNSWVPTYGMNFGGSFTLAKRTILMASQVLTHQPLYALVRPPDLPEMISDPLDPPVTPSTIQSPAGSVLDAYLRSNSAVTLSQAVARHVNVSVGATYDVTPANQVTSGFRSSLANGGISWVVSKDFGAHFNYGYGWSQYASLSSDDELKLKRQNFDFGVDYQRTLSVSRRTKLNFWTGTTAVSDGLPGSTELHFDVIGGARLLRELGRTWGAQLAYSRSVDFVETFLAPVSSDSLTGSLNGSFNRRLQFQSYVGASRGTVGFEDGRNGYYTYYAGTSLTYGLTRLLGLGTSYSYYIYHYETGVPLPPGYPPKFDRNSVRAYLSAQLPIFQRSGRSNATR